MENRRPYSIKQRARLASGLSEVAPVFRDAMPTWNDGDETMIGDQL